MSGIITLTTDFGWDDHLVGAMKGAILSVNDQAAIIDITHSVQPHNILEGAFILKGAYRYFPSRTVHLAVVDPGVGSSRRCLAVASEKFFFVGPDNGILSLVLDELERYTCLEMDADHYFRHEVSATFHGRDIFSPVAGWLSRGINYKHLGHPVDDPVRLSMPNPRHGKKGVEGQVIFTDRFGNLITNITRADLEKASGGGPAVCRIPEKSAETIPLKNFYQEVAAGKPLALVGSSGYLEVAVNQGSATKLLKTDPGTRVLVIGT